MSNLLLDQSRVTEPVGWEFTGVVVHGDARGRELGFPTANLELDDHRTFPADGVYVADVEVPAFFGRRPLRRRAALSVGTNPTFDGRELRVEAHLLDFTGDLYGRRMSVTVLDTVRATRRFAGVAELVAQISSDVEVARGWPRSAAPSVPDLQRSSGPAHEWRIS